VTVRRHVMVRRLATLLAGLVAVGGCTASSKSPRTLPAAGNGPAGVYVAIGASETRGVGTSNPLREAWPQLVFSQLPAGYTFINLGVSGATVSDALTQELPVAQSLHPTVVTVWLNVNDLLAGVSATRFESELRSLIGSLRRAGVTVLVANTPPLDQLPAYLGCIDPATHPGGCPAAVPRPIPTPAQVDAAVEGYNSTIARVVADTGAVLVDLHAAGLAARARGQEQSLISADGFHPNSAGARVIADQFVAALRRAGIRP
jgi:lysophospholipase L1-like esterase